MKFPFLLISGVSALLLLQAGVTLASPILWTLNDVTLSDGGTASGSFTFDPDFGTPCGFASPCGTYSNVEIATTSGSARTGTTYSFVCGQNVVNCTGVKADSTEVLFLTSNATNQTGDPAIAFFFTGTSGLPPQGLTDAGGTLDISNSSPSVGTVQEGNCVDAHCSSPAGPVRFATAGTVSAAPEPATWLFVTAGFGVIALNLTKQNSSEIEFQKGIQK